MVEAKRRAWIRRLAPGSPGTIAGPASSAFEKPGQAIEAQIGERSLRLGAVTRIAVPN